MQCFVLKKKVIQIIQLFSEDFVKFSFLVFFAVLFSFLPVSAQVDSVIGQFTSSNVESFAGGISGDGRLVVFESTGNLATENPRNADGNREIFLFDYAQRRIFQITDTKSLLTDPTKAGTTDNIKVEITNVRPVISNDGRWIAFGSNATCAYPGNPFATPPIPAIVTNSNPGSFDPNITGESNSCLVGTNNNLVNDGNTEMWLYQVPSVAPVNLSLGSEIPVTNLSAGTFVQVTNTLPSRLPVAGSATSDPIIADDNRNASINDNGNIIAFVSNRDLVPCSTTASATCGNASPNFNNPEIYSFVRPSNTLAQVTATPRGTAALPIYNANPTISFVPPGVPTLSIYRVAFISNAQNPIVGMTGGSNPENNEEIYFTDLDASGNPTGTRRQVTQTAPTNPGDVVNILNYGRRMSRDGRYIAFDSYAALESGGAIQPSFGLYLYDTTASSFRLIGPRSDADSAAAGGDVARYPGFTDYDDNLTPRTLVLETRLNINSAGTVPATAGEGLNPETGRPVQIYSYTLSPEGGASATFTRLTKFPLPAALFASTQPIPSNSVRRMTFNLALTEIGTGNNDLLSEAFYFLLPVTASENSGALTFETGASRIPVSASPVPTPTASPSPTPQTPPAVQGLSPGMLAIVNLPSGVIQPAPQTAVGSLQRVFPLPIELGGVTLTIKGAAAGLKSVSPQQIVFVVPRGLTASGDTPYDLVINNNGVVFRSKVTIVLARPDVFNFAEEPSPGGRARVFNATNRVLTREPFTVTTIRQRGGRRVPTVLRLFLTGVEGVPASAVTIRVGSVQISGAQILTGAIEREPGVYSIDFTLPSTLDKAGDVPIIVTITGGSQTFTSRLDDTAPRLFIL